jgi:hypothetical protein
LPEVVIERYQGALLVHADRKQILVGASASARMVATSCPAARSNSARARRDFRQA